MDLLFVSLFLGSLIFFFLSYLERETGKGHSKERLVGPTYIFCLFFLIVSMVGQSDI